MNHLPWHTKHNKINLLANYIPLEISDSSFQILMSRSIVGNSTSASSGIRAIYGKWRCKHEKSEILQISLSISCVARATTKHTQQPQTNRYNTYKHPYISVLAGLDLIEWYSLLSSPVHPFWLPLLPRYYCGFWDICWCAGGSGWMIWCVW